MSHFMVVEGSEGVGKTTNLDFIEAWLKAHEFEVVRTREPGGTPLAEKVRDLLLHTDVEMDGEVELLLVMAARRSHINEVIAPALAAGKVVLCDRFVDSTYAYQGYGREMDLSRLDALSDWTLQGLTPDSVILLDAPVEHALKRIENRSHDRVEQSGVAFFERVRNGFLARALRPNHHVIDASNELSHVQQSISECLNKIFQKP